VRGFQQGVAREVLLHSGAQRVVVGDHEHTLGLCCESP